MTVYMWIATTAWALLGLGVINRGRRERHVPLVVAGIVVDLLLVLYLQATRGAVQKALEFSMGPLQQLHIGFSTLALILYLPVVVFGRRLLRGQGGERTRQLHRRFALTAFAARTLGFLLMFSMWK